MANLKIHHTEPGVPGMSKTEIEKFLSIQKIPMRLATIDHKGDPSIHPVWYYYESDKLYLFAGRNAKKIQHLQKNTKVYFSVDTDDLPNKGVKGKGTAQIVTDPNKMVELSEKIVEKYLGDAKTGHGKNMVDSVKRGVSTVVEIRPHYYTVWDYGKSG